MLISLVQFLKESIILSVGENNIPSHETKRDPSQEITLLGKTD